MLKIYDNVMDLQHLAKIKDTILCYYKENKLRNEQNDYVKNCFGEKNIPVTLENIEEMKEKVRQDYGSDYEFTHSYSRIYFNGGLLSIHVDRLGLDLTGTLTVFNNLDEPWPIHFSKKQYVYPHEKDYPDQGNFGYRRDFTSIDVKPNQMAVCLGTRTPHWRDKLVCRPDQYSIHVFYHWKYKGN